jgi:hypothetical protein
MQDVANVIETVWIINIAGLMVALSSSKFFSQVPSRFLCITSI